MSVPVLPNDWSSDYGTNRTDYVKSSIYKPFAQNTDQDVTASRGAMYTRKIMELAMNRFKWEGLPDTIDPRFVEMTLYMNPLAIFFRHPDNGRYMVWRGSMQGWVDYQDNPVKYLALGNSQDQPLTLEAGECVPIWPNYSRMPDWDITRYYAGMLAEFDKSIEMTVINSRQPVVLVIDSAGKNRLGLENMYRQIRSGQLAIGVYDGAGVGEKISDSIEAIDLGVKTAGLSDYQVAKTRMWNECMTFFGIDNANQDKKERLVESEVDANDSQIMQFRNTALNARRYACEKINKMFPELNVSVEWNEEQPPAEMPAAGTDNSDEGEGSDNG